MLSSYHYLVLPEIFQQVSYLRSTMPPSRCAQPQCNIYSRHSIIVITPYCFVAQPSVVLLTTAAVVWLATAYEATCAATCCALHSLSNMYIRDDTLECSPAFSLFCDYKVSSLLLNLYSSNDLRSSSQILIQTLPRFQTILLVFAFDKVNRY